MTPSRTRRRLAWILCVMVSVPWLAHAQEIEPTDEVKGRYQVAVESAVAEYAAGNWGEARALFLQAHELWPSARTFRTLGMTSFELKTYARAVQELDAALQDTRRPLDDTKRAEVSALLQRARAFVGRFVIEVPSADVTLDVDGRRVELGAERVLLLDIGQHAVVGRAPGHRDASVALTVEGNEDTTLTLRPEPIVTDVVAPVTTVNVPSAVPSDDASARTTSAATSGRLWSWIGLGTTVALGAASIGLWIAADAEFTQLDQQCMSTCVRGEVDTSTYDALLWSSRIGVGLTVAAAAGTVVAFVLESDDDAAPITRLHISPWGAALHTRF